MCIVVHVEILQHLPKHQHHEQRWHVHIAVAISTCITPVQSGIENNRADIWDGICRTACTRPAN
jgi:hypothetical protein